MGEREEEQARRQKMEPDRRTKPESMHEKYTKWSPTGIACIAPVSRWGAVWKTPNQDRFRSVSPSPADDWLLGAAFSAGCLQVVHRNAHSITAKSREKEGKAVRPGS